jgi:hypothetical protein
MAAAEKKPAAQSSGEDQVKAAFDEAAEKGYFGYSPDPTPRENYSLQTPPDAPTPETEAAKQRAKDAGR